MAYHESKKFKLTFPGDFYKVLTLTCLEYIKLFSIKSLGLPEIEVPKKRLVESIQNMDGCELGIDLIKSMKKKGSKVIMSNSNLNSTVLCKNDQFHSNLNRDMTPSLADNILNRLLNISGEREEKRDVLLCLSIPLAMSVVRSDRDVKNPKKKIIPKRRGS